MEKILEAITQTDDLCGNIVSAQQYQELSTLLKQRTHLYREESMLTNIFIYYCSMIFCLNVIDALLERLLADLRALNDDVKLATGNYSSLGDIRNVCEKFEMTDINTNALSLSQTEKLRKHNNYVSKLKTCIKLYMNLNEKLLKHLKATKL